VPVAGPPSAPPTPRDSIQRWLLVLLLLSSGLGWAQGQPAPPAAPTAEDPLQLIADARILYVARTLNLRADQVAKIIPLLNQAQARMQARTATLDSLWGRGQGSIATVDQSLMAGTAPDRATQNAVAGVVAGHDQARANADGDLERIAGQVLAVLDQPQLASVETLQERQGQQRNEERFSGTADLAAYVGRYAAGMRQLQPEEYDLLRVPMGLRLAQLLVAPNAPGYNRAVGDMLRILDSVRRLTDADFAQAEPNLPVSVAQALGLPEETVAQSHPVSFDDLMALVSNPRTATLLQTFKAEPAMEVVP